MKTKQRFFQTDRYLLRKYAVAIDEKWSLRNVIRPFNLRNLWVCRCFIRVSTIKDIIGYESPMLRSLCLRITVNNFYRLILHWRISPPRRICETILSFLWIRQHASFVYSWLYCKLMLKREISNCLIKFISCAKRK